MQLLTKLRTQSLSLALRCLHLSTLFRLVSQTLDGTSSLAYLCRNYYLSFFWRCQVACPRTHLPIWPSLFFVKLLSYPFVFLFLHSHAHLSSHPIIESRSYPLTNLPADSYIMSEQISFTDQIQRAFGSGVCTWSTQRQTIRSELGQSMCKQGSLKH